MGLSLTGSWTTGEDRSLSHIRRIGDDDDAGRVHEVFSLPIHLNDRFVGGLEYVVRPNGANDRSSHESSSV
jgi:hypothetical protein